MDSEKDLLKKDLENQDTPEKVNKFIEDVELLGHEDIAELGRQKLADLESKAVEVSKTNESQISQIENMNGDTEEVNERIKDIDQKIQTLKTETIKQIEGIQNQEDKKGITVIELQNICKDNTISLKDKIKKLRDNGAFTVEYQKLAVENSKYSIEEAKDLVINDVLDLSCLPDNIRKEIYTIGDLYKKLDNEFDRLSNSTDAFDPSSLRELSLAYGGIDELNAQHYIEKIDKLGKVNPYIKDRAEQVKAYIKAYSKK